LIPTGKHTDWYWPLSLIPRKWTAIPSEREPFGVIIDDVGMLWVRPKTWNLDVPVRNSAMLVFSRYGFMFSVNAKGWLFRIGTFRYDYVDSYVELFTLALKRHS
jgi:hypothetical protein